MPGDPLSQLRRGTIEFCVLALLRDQPLYGLELSRRLVAADGLVASDGTIYPLLARLRRQGLVETDWVESATGPPRRYYRLTPKGREALHSFVLQWRTFRDSVDQVIAATGSEPA